MNLKVFFDPIIGQLLHFDSRGQTLDITTYLSRPNPLVVISMHMDEDLSLCIPLPYKNCLIFPISILRARLEQLVHFKEVSVTLSRLCNNDDTLGHTL